MESMAVPARPGKSLLEQPDGSSLEVYLKGDEFLHYYTSVDNILLKQAENGFWKYAVLSDDGVVVAGKFVARNQNVRSQEEREYIKNIDKASLNRVLVREATETRAGEARKVAPGGINKPFPTTGVVRGLVILAQYQDVKFTEKATLEVYRDLVNQEGYKGDLASGSVRDYFIDQSEGVFTPEFDVVGPVTLPNERAFYGKGKMGNENVSQMVIDACLLADKEYDVDFSQYDRNNDGEVDFIYVIYAGYGEAQGGPAESVWPQSGTLKYEYYKTLDGMYLGSYSCSCELRGKEGEELDGIGTFCHEFSHILGLPDIYDAGGTGLPGLENWDVMDRGSYNDDSKTPAGYTAMDKYTVGWLNPIVLENPQAGISLESLSSSNKAYFIVNSNNPNEYYTLENRQLEGWDAKLPGHGLLICHVNYDLGVWNLNRVNSNASGYEHVKLIAADGNDISGEAGDLFPGTTLKTSFTDNSKPAAIWRTGEHVGKPVLNIREEGGVIYFDFIEASPVENIRKEGLSAFTAGGRIKIVNPSSWRIAVYSIDGRLIGISEAEFVDIPVSKGIYVIKAGDQILKVCAGH